MARPPTGGWPALVLGLSLAAPAPAAEARRFTDAFDAYQAGDYDEALRLFLDTQVDRPTDPRVDYDIGNAQYRRGDYQAAAEAYARALAAQDPALRAQASYNLGNALFRAQKLDDAVKAYEQTLGLAPRDQDARFNLELARKMIEEQKKQEQKKQDDQQKTSDESKEQQQQQQEPKDGKDSQQRQQEQQQQQQGQEQGSQQQQQQQEQQDGAKDASKQQGASPGDSQDPKGKGKAAVAQPAGEGPDKDRPPGARAVLSREEAARYLQQLGDSRPRLPRNQKGGRSSPPAKDW